MLVTLLTMFRGCRRIHTVDLIFFTKFDDFIDVLTAKGFLDYNNISLSLISYALI
jgi:hypothetical protein